MNQSTPQDLEATMVLKALRPLVDPVQIGRIVIQQQPGDYTRKIHGQWVFGSDDGVFRLGMPPDYDMLRFTAGANENLAAQILKQVEAQIDAKAAACGK